MFSFSARSLVFSSLKCAASLGVLMALTSCSSFLHTPTAAEQGKEIARFEPLRDAKDFATNTSQPQSEQQQPQTTKFKSGPGISITRTVADATAKELSLNLTGAPISGNYHNIPLPVFINEVFGEQLGLSFTLDPQIEKQEDLVTLRLIDAVAPAELFRIAMRTLNTYGVAVSQQGDVLSFVIDKNITAGETPLLVSGRTLPEVPQSHRPIFMFVPLKVVTNAKVAGWVRDALTGKDIQVNEDSSRNAVLLKGKPDLVNQALAIIEVLDQPVMRGKFSTSIEPAFVKVEALSKNLKEVLNAEGYDANIKSSTGSIILIPLEGTNQLVVFASSQQIINHVRDWVEVLDRRQQMSIDQGIFTYEVRNTQAAHIVQLLNSFENGGSTGNSRSGINSGALDSGSAISDVTTNSGMQGSGVQGASARINGGNFVVDTNRNTIIYKGSGQAWLDMLPVIQTLDKAAPSVLIEVLLAEVTLNDSERTGFEFVATGSQKVGGQTYASRLSTLGGLGLGTSGLSATLNSAGDTRAVLNLFYENKRAEIRSRPRLMVKSGQQATIDVGTEVPTVSSNAQSTTNSDAPILQSIQYRKTGVRLTVSPVVHASGHVDIEIDQELSEAQPNESSNIDSPSVFNRSIQTTVTLQDGGSILLGGLISSNKSVGNTGVPWFGKMPIIGKLLSADNNSSARTELMVMIIPYVIDTPSEGQSITKSIQQAFQQPVADDLLSSDDVQLD